MLKFEELLKTKFVKHGVPFVLLIVGGSFGLKNFTSLRYDYSKSENLTREQKAEVEKLFKKPSECDIDKVYEDYKQLDLDQWQNKRIPRPWDENEQQQ